MNIILESGTIEARMVPPVVACPGCHRPIRYMFAFMDQFSDHDVGIVPAELVGELPIDPRGLARWMRHQCEQGP